MNIMAPIPPPPPPPPPLPMGAPLPSGMPPMPPGFLPPGMPPNFALPPPPVNDMLIPQPAAPKAELAVASAVGDGGGVSLSAPTMAASNATSAKAAPISLPVATANEASKKKSNNKLVFSGEDLDENGEELSMEELRMRVPRIWVSVAKALTKRNEASA